MGLPPAPVSQVDASWIDQGTTSGLGWAFTDTVGQEYEGSRGCRRCLSALHAEFDGLLWAMECMKERQYFTTRFQTDCQDLLKMIREPMEWPAFRTELDEFLELRGSFATFSLSYIPRSLNVRADSLAKGARARNSIFSHVNFDESVVIITTDQLMF